MRVWDLFWLLITVDHGVIGTQGAAGLDLPRALAPTTAAACPGLAQCLGHPECRVCLSAVLPLSNLSSSAATTLFREPAFFQALLTTPACGSGINNTNGNGNGSTVEIPLNQTLHELMLYTPEHNPLCSRAIRGVTAAYCQVAELTCFFTGSGCRECLANITASSRLHRALSQTLQSASCTTAATSLQKLAYGESPTRRCFFFPRCSFAKVQCARSAGCRRGWAAVARGDVAAAVAACPPSTQLESDAVLLDHVVNECTASTEVGCRFWQARCLADPRCNDCFEALGLDRSAEDIVTGSASPACAGIVARPIALWYLGNYVKGCPATVVDECRGTTYFCVMFDPFCDNCLRNDTARPTSFCQDIIGPKGYDLASVCSGCPNEIAAVNKLTLATAVVGGVSVVACLGVIGVIVSVGAHRRALRDRVVLTVMVANAIYSSANMIPENLLKDGAVGCGEAALSFATIRFGRSWWFCGKVRFVSCLFSSISLCGCALISFGVACVLVIWMVRGSTRS